ADIGPPHHTTPQEAQKMSCPAERSPYPTKGHQGGVAACLLAKVFTVGDNAYQTPGRAGTMAVGWGEVGEMGRWGGDHALSRDGAAMSALSAPSLTACLLAKVFTVADITIPRVA